MQSDFKRASKAEQFYRKYQTDLTMLKDTPPCSFFELFAFADRCDMVLMLIGAMFALGNGLTIIFYSQPLSDLANTFAPNHNPNTIVEATKITMMAFAFNSVLVLLSSWGMTAAWTITSQRQMISVRKAYFNSLLRQQMQWYEKNKPESLCAKMYIDISKVHQTLLHNLTSVLTKLSIGICGIAFALFKGREMAFVMIFFLPVMMLTGFLNSKYSKDSSELFTTQKTDLDSKVIEVFSNFKTIKFLNAENYELLRFSKQLSTQSQLYRELKIKSALAFAVFFCSILLNYALGFWYGTQLIFENIINSSTGEVYTIGDVLSIFVCIYLSNLSFCDLMENVGNFDAGRVCMQRILNLIGRVSLEPAGDQTFEGVDEIILEGVGFEFEKPLFEGLNLRIKKGLVSLIGRSGCGKTTLINLINKFYFPFEGRILLRCSSSLLDLNSIRDSAFRSKIAFVGQEPALLGKTLRESLEASSNTLEEIMFVLDLTQSLPFVHDIGLDTPYQSLSGGQKQRIAIARALLRKPEILILDEATSALDSKNQQDVLKNIQQKSAIKFIIMIAHRLETIRNSNQIAVLQNGKIVAQGTYAQLQSMGKLNENEITSRITCKEDPILKEKATESKKQMIELIHSEDKKESEESNSEDLSLPIFSYFKKLLSFNSNRNCAYIIASLCSVVLGTIFPLFSFVLSNMITLLAGIKYSKSLDFKDQFVEEALNFSKWLFIISLIALLLTAIKGVLFVNLTQELVVKLKNKLMKDLLGWEMGKIEETGSHHLSFAINNSCDNLKGMGGVFIGDFLDLFSTLITGLVIAFIHSWEITLISFAILPLIFVAGKFNMDYRNGLSSHTESLHLKTHEIIIECISNIKTVRSLNIEDRLVLKYSDELGDSLQHAIKFGNLAGLMFGLGQSLICIMLVILCYLGSLFIAAGTVSVLDLYTSIFAIMFAGVQAGGNSHFLSKLAEAKTAAIKYFSYFQSNHDEVSKFGSHELTPTNLLEQSGMKGEKDIEFEHVCFKYEERKEGVLDDLSLKIEGSRQKTAIVGESGSGKSTIASLLMKIYSPQEGAIFYGQHNLQDLDPFHIHQEFAIVSQEPVLFNRSIFENIQYNSNCSFAEVVSAAKLVKAFDFIMAGQFGASQESSHLSDYDNFNKLVGPKGSFLSGGQKQRIAIARALVRKPKLLILDEATSALDNETERQILKMLSSEGMQQLVIAHRLSTIKSCDWVVMMGGGKVIEEGTYQDLVGRKKHFFDLTHSIPF